MLRRIPSLADPRLIVGDNPADDSAVFRVRDDLALVQTLDFFAPIVDDPYVFGQIAAANALSDVYAVGGTPVTALNVACFPMGTLPKETLAAILTGGAEKAREAGVAIIGGHTIDDEEPKYGLAVTGTVDPNRMITSRGARPGDLLVLTKPLGTGAVATALKAGAATEAHVGQAARWMTTLNRSASHAMLVARAHAATDITGYGLLGHLLDFCRASGVGATIHASAVPHLPGALDYIAAGFIPNGARTNAEYVQNEVAGLDRLDETTRVLLNDPQTSGGLVVAVDRDSLGDFVSETAPDALAAVVGEVTVPSTEKHLKLVS